MAAALALITSVLAIFSGSDSDQLSRAEVTMASLIETFARHEADFLKASQSETVLAEAQFRWERLLEEMQDDPENFDVAVGTLNIRSKDDLANNPMVSGVFSASPNSVDMVAAQADDQDFHVGFVFWSLDDVNADAAWAIGRDDPTASGYMPPETSTSPGSRFVGPCASSQDLREIHAADETLATVSCRLNADWILSYNHYRGT